MLLPLLLLACTGDVEPEPLPELQAGFARARIPAPVGIGTAGFGPFGAPTSRSPFAEIYPATTRLHGHPEIKVLVLDRGPDHRVAFVRLDAVGVFQQLRRALVLELEERTGEPWDDALVVGATHTHSGPGRIIDGGGVYDIIADRFLPEFYERFVDTVADTVLAAMDDRQPARLGGVNADCAVGHSDRRCEDGRDYTNGRVPLLVVERNGQVDTVLMPFAIHGTVLGIGELTLSQDVSGAIEQAVEDRFDHPVEVIQFNSWGADMAPADPEVPQQEGAAQLGGYDRMERVGSAVADAVHAALPGVTWWDDPTIRLETHRLFIDREVIGYDDETFPYDYGGVYCESEAADCDPATTEEGLDRACVPFNAQTPAPNQSVMTAGQVGDFTLVTFPGEPGTLLAEALEARLRGHMPGLNDVLFLGYTQDYIGYSILEDDWWQGGYEASGALWGPRQGEYLLDQAERVAVETLMSEGPGALEPLPIVPFADPTYEPWGEETPIEPGTILEDVAAEVGPADVVVLTLSGRDPWLGAPLAHLVDADGQPVLRPNGVPVDSDGYHFWLDLAPDPPYTEDADARRFVWRVAMPVQHSTDQGVVLDGDYKLLVDIPDGAGGWTRVESGVFTVAR